MKFIPLSLFFGAALPLMAADAPVRNLGRVMFCGDSITHGVNDATYRWQLFKIFVDDGVEFNIVGPRVGFSTPSINSTDATVDGPNTYRDKEFDNVHLAMSSGRTYNILTGSKEKGGVDYGGHSTKDAADEAYNARTYFCLMGTNDLISDKGKEPADFVAKMQKLIGGTVKENKGKYTWTPSADSGTMGQIVADLLKEKDDVLYVLTVPTWTRHCNNNEPAVHAAVQQYNELLKQWAKTQKRVKVVEINKGLVDPAVQDAFFSNDAFFTSPGRDGLHPNEQGSMLMAGNLAKGMKLPGRTAGLERGDIRDQSPQGRKKAAEKLTLKPGETKGASVDSAMGNTPVGTLEFSAKVGNGAAGGWETDKGLTARFGDGTHAGSLRLTENAILWGNKVLYCRDNSKPGNELLRVAYVVGNPALRVAPGYYVWLGDVLIGQALPLEQGGSSGVSFCAELPTTVSSVSTSQDFLAPAAPTKEK